jgi:hypothetical protein
LRLDIVIPAHNEEHRIDRTLTAYRAGCADPETRFLVAAERIRDAWPMPPDAPPLRTRAIRAVLIAVVLQAMFVFFFVFPSHDPEPNGLPVAVVGSAQAAGAFGAALRQRGDFDVRRAASPAEARALIEDREVYGAYVLSSGPAVRRTIVASAASLPAAQIVTEVGRRAGSLSQVDVAPLPEHDPRGVTLNLLVLPLVITSILMSIVAANLVPDIDARRRIGLAALAAVAGGLIAVAIVNWWLDALEGPWLAQAAVIALAVIAIALTSAGIIRLLGPPGIAVPFLLFLMLGNPASGVASAPELLPTPWAELGQFLPPGALGSALRGTSYFDGAGVLVPILVLLAWVALGLGLLVVSARRAPSAAPVPAPA